MKITNSGDARVATRDLIIWTHGRVCGDTGRRQWKVWPQCVATRDLKQWTITRVCGDTQARTTTTRAACVATLEPMASRSACMATLDVITEQWSRYVCRRHKSSCSIKLLSAVFKSFIIKAPYRKRRSGFLLIQEDVLGAWIRDCTHSCADFRALSLTKSHPLRRELLWEKWIDSRELHRSNLGPVTS